MKNRTHLPKHDPNDPLVLRLSVPLWVQYPGKKILLSKEEEERREALMVKGHEIRWDFE